MERERYGIYSGGDIKKRCECVKVKASVGWEPKETKRVNARGDAEETRRQTGLMGDLGAFLTLEKQKKLFLKFIIFSLQEQICHVLQLAVVVLQTGFMMNNSALHSRRSRFTAHFVNSLCYWRVRIGAPARLCDDTFSHSLWGSLADIKLHSMLLLKKVIT